METIPDEKIVVWLRDWDREVSATLGVNGELIFASISGYRDPRLSDKQVEQILAKISRRY